MLKVGVVGLGAMGQHHVRLYSQMSMGLSSRIARSESSRGLSSWSLSEGFQGGVDSWPKTHNPELSPIALVGVADANPDRAKELGSKYNVPYYSDYHHLLGEVDAVSIAVPTTLHYSVAMDFLEEGVHCLVEKPIAFSLDEAGAMIKAAYKNKVKLAVGHIERFNPAVVRLKQIIEAGILGKILIISTRRVGPYVPRIRDVGVVIDSATHDIGVVKYLIGREPVSVFSRVGSLKHSKEDHAIIVLDFEGTTACLEVNWYTPYKVRTLVATGSEGIAYLDYIDQTVVVHNSHDNNSSLRAPMIPEAISCNNVSVQKPEPLKLELLDFLSSIITDGKPAVDGIEGQGILKIALECSKNNYIDISSLVRG